MKEGLHPRSRQATEIKMISFNQGPRACIQLENGLILRLPISVKSIEDMGDYEWATLEALEKDSGLEFALSQLGSGYEAHLPIGENWYTTASVIGHDGEVIFCLYHGAN